MLDDHGKIHLLGPLELVSERLVRHVPLNDEEKKKCYRLAASSRRGGKGKVPSKELLQKKMLTLLARQSDTHKFRDV